MVKECKTPHPWRQFLAIKYWPLWTAIGLIWLINQLPYRWQLRIGAAVGWLLEKIPSKAKRTATINLQLCFPEWSVARRQQLLRENFKATGVAAIETGLAWWGSAKKLQGLLHIHGLDRIKQALAAGKGILLCSAHLTCLEIVGRMVQQAFPVCVVYRPQKNKLLNALAEYYRGHCYDRIIARHDLRGMLRTLQQNKPLWYTPDVDAGKKNSIFIPFFGITTASITATSRLAQRSGAIVLTSFFYRRDDGTGYDVYFTPVENFPSDDVIADTQRINDLIEAAVRKQPAQYLWQYKRFKTRPEGEQRFY